jgi:hypothetical protein
MLQRPVKGAGSDVLIAPNEAFNREVRKGFAKVAKKSKIKYIGHYCAVG